MESLKPRVLAEKMQNRHLIKGALFLQDMNNTSLVSRSLKFN